MKNYLLLFAVLSSFLFYGQEGETEITQQENGIYHNGIKIKTTPISSIKAAAGASMYLTGIGSVKSWALINGETSKLNINADSLAFTVYFGDEVKDDFEATLINQITSPEDLLLFKLDVKNKVRRLEIGDLGTFSGYSSGLDSENAIEFDYEDLGNGIYELTLKNTTKNGEYAFVTSQWYGVTTKVWSFTVFDSKYISPEQQKKNLRKAKREKRKNN